MSSQYFRRLSVIITLLSALALLPGQALAEPPSALEKERIDSVLPGVSFISEQEGEF
ncbi:hypothetical protein DFQ45_1061, partial [Thiopseudomonas denitrificans]